MSHSKHKLSATRAWCGFALLALAYCLGYGLLVFPSSVSHLLESGLNANPFDIGIISTAFLLTYVAMQIPAGLILDYFCIKKIMFSVCACMAAGCFILSVSTDIYFATLSRLLMGFGASFTFLAALAYGRNYFAPILFALITGLTEMMSGIGALSFNTLFAKLSYSLGWREVIFATGIAALVIGTLITLIIKTNKKEKKQHSTYSLNTQISIIFRRKRIWLITFYTGFSFTHFMVLTNLWDTSFFSTFYHISMAHAALINSLTIVGFIAGCPLYGYLSEHRSTIKLLISSALAQVLLIMFIHYLNANITIAEIALFILGLATGSVVLCFDIAKSYVPKQVYGTVSGLVNLFFGGIAILIMPLVSYIYAQGHNLYGAVFPIVVCSGIAVILITTLYLIDQNIPLRQYRKALSDKLEPQ